MPNIYLGLGSNISDKIANLNKAVGLISGIEGIVVGKMSPIYKTEPQNEIDKNEWFLNAVLHVTGSILASRLLKEIKSIENTMGRRSSDKRYDSRIIDIDILLYEDELIKTMDLVIPHPELLKRRFAMIPLLDLDPEIKDPASKIRIADYLAKTNKLNQSVLKLI